MSDFGLKQPRAKRKRVETPPVAPPSAMAPDGRDVDTRRAEVMESLIRAAGRGMPKKLCAWAAGVTPRTLLNWLSDEREPYATFTRRWYAAFGERGGELIDAVALTRPEYLLNNVYKLKPPETKTVNHHTVSHYTTAQVQAELERRGYRRPNVESDANEGRVDADHSLTAGDDRRVETIIDAESWSARDRADEGDGG